jgi:hypothetical protein
LYRHANAEPARDVGLNQVERADFDAGEPIHAQPGQSLLEILADDLSGWQAKERFLDLVAMPKLVGGGDAAVLFNGSSLFSASGFRLQDAHLQRFGLEFLSCFLVATILPV